MTGSTHRRTFRRAVVAVATLGCALVFVGCEQPDWTDTDYLISKLESNDATDRQRAIDNLDDLDDEAQQEAAGPLAEVYLDGDRNQKEAMKLLVKIRSKDAKDAYLHELRENETGYAGAAAEALGEAGVDEALDDMVELYESTDDNETKLALLRAFKHLPDPKVVPLLTETLKLDVDNFPIRLHSDSCDVLGFVGDRSPEAIDRPARKALILGMFQANNKGQDTSKECSLALQRVGQAAVPELIETFKGENEEVNSLLRKFNRGPDYQFPENRAKVDTAIMLGMMRAEEAVDLFLEDLEQEKSAPGQLSGTHASQWRMTEAEATSEQILALGDIGDEKARDFLVDVVTDEYTNDEWDEITDGFIELQLRQDAGNALVRLGDRSAADALFEMAKDGVIIDIERRAAQLENTEQPMAVEERYQFNWMMAKNYADLTEAGPDKLASLAEGTEEEELKEKFEGFVPKLQKGEECFAKDGDQAQAECFGKLLEDDNQRVRKKAAHELARLSAEAAGPVIIDHLDHRDLETREVLTYSAFRVPVDGMRDKIEEVVESEKKRRSDEYKRDHLRLQHLHAWLGHNKEAIAEK